MLLQLFNPPPDHGSALVWARDVERLAVATELKVRVACVGAHLAKNPLYRGEVAVRRKTDRLRPCGSIAQQLAGVAWIDRDQWRAHIGRLDVQFEKTAFDGFECHILDAKTERVEQERSD